MTVANETARTSATGTAAAGQEIAYSFPANADTDLLVMTRVTATGVEATLTLTTDYTATVSDTGGTVTLVNALAATSTCHVIRQTPNTQALDLTAGGSFDAENLEEGLDKVTRMATDNADLISRCVRLPETDAALDMELDNSVDRASNYLGFDSSGNVTVVSSVAPATATISSFGETLIDDANAAAARTTMGVAIGTDVQAWDDDLDDIAALTPTDGNIMVGDGTDWVAENGATARTSLGAAADADVAKKDGSVAYTGTGVGFRDEDDMLSNDATAPPSQQSVRAFVWSILTYDSDVLSYDGEVMTYS
jgi:hypothetical protein